MDDQQRSAREEGGQVPQQDAGEWRPQTIPEPSAAPSEASSAPPEESSATPASEASSPDPSWPSCPWCSTRNAPDAQTCASCAAALKPAEAEERSIYGVTAVDPGLVEHDQWLRTLKERKKGMWAQVFGSEPKEPKEESRDYVVAADPAVFQPPDPSVKNEMARLAAEVAAARALAEAEARRAEELLAAQDLAAAEQRAAMEQAAGAEQTPGEEAPGEEAPAEQTRAEAPAPEGEPAPEASSANAPDAPFR